MSLSNLQGSPDVNYATPGVEACEATLGAPLTIPNDNDVHILPTNVVLTGNNGLFGNASPDDGVLVKRDGFYNIETLVTLGSTQGNLNVSLVKVENSVTKTLREWIWLGDYGSSTGPAYQTLSFSAADYVNYSGGARYYIQLQKTLSGGDTFVANNNNATVLHIMRLGDVVSHGLT